MDLKDKLRKKLGKSCSNIISNKAYNAYIKTMQIGSILQNDALYGKRYRDDMTEVF